MFFSCDLTVETWSSYGLFILNQPQKETNIILSEIAYPSSLKRNLHVVYPSFRLWFYMMPPFGLPPPPPSTPDNYYTVPKLCLSLSAKQRRNHFFWFPTCVPRFEYAWRFPAPPPPPYLKVWIRHCINWVHVSYGFLAAYSRFSRQFELPNESFTEPDGWSFTDDTWIEPSKEITWVEF